MEFKGTKGKWKLNGVSPFQTERGEYAGGFEVVSDIDEEIKVVEVMAYSFWGLTIDEAESNAKLIASAPEMFELLKDIFDDNEVFAHLYLGQRRKIEQLLTKITEL